ncbi:MAG: bacillithiol biosynthesis cysteine-adding enzyme BshC [Ignavibacteriae bacterium]|nr:bacillithiol biosynthesis cysteine-adding enzyme BshC [Ignavibacteriota bacterium]
MSVSFLERNDFNELYLDYTHSFEKVKDFFAYDYRNEKEFIRCAEDKKKTYLKNANFDRNQLADILTEQNENFNLSQAALTNIEQLREEYTFAVVTGQQVGMLSGPLYTIYKAVNTIKLANELSEKFPDYKFVPVFWLECEDHDFLEINNISVLNKKNELERVSYYEGGEPKEKYLTPVGKIVLDEYINKFKDEIKEALQETDFTGELTEAIDKAYSEGVDMKTAFARFLNYVIRDSGLVFCDPSDVRIKELLVPVYEKELATFSQLSEIVIGTTADIEVNYEPQVKPRAINLFYLHEENRYALQPHESGLIALKNSRQKFEKEELFQILYATPEKFSTNVITRPIAQDYLLPTIAYVGGPSEISYFAQLKGAYEYFGVTMPVIFPRTTVTLLEKRVTAFLEKNSLDFVDLFDERALSEKLIAKTDQTNVEELFTKYLDALNSLNFEFANELEQVDKNVVNSLKNKAQKNVEIIEDFKKKFQDAQLRQNDTNLAKMRSVIESVYPNSTLQERVYNIIYFLNKYSPDLINYLYNEINLWDFDHQVIGISPDEE